MGNKPSQQVGYQELRDSIPGSLVTEQDFELFYSLCKIDTVRTISNVLHPNPSQLFLVVVSGEVSVQLTSSNLKQKTVTALTYYPGETIHFFNGPISPSNTNFEFNDTGECFRNGDIKLSLIFKSYPKSVARVIGMDRRAYDELLLTAKSNLHAFTSFVGLRMTEFAEKSPHFRAITAEQMSIFGPLIKVRLSHIGKVIPAYPPPPQRTPTAGSKKAENPLVTQPPADCQYGCLTVVLSGGVLSVPSSTNMSTLIAKITGAEGSFNTKKKKTPMANLKYRAPPTMPVAQSQTGTPHVFSISDLEKPVPSVERDNSNRGRTPVQLSAGSVFGVDDYLIRSGGSRVAIRTNVTTAPSVLGHVSHAAMDALFQADPRFDRVFKRNCFVLILHWVKTVVPFLQDMDDWSLALLSCKIFMKGYDTGATIGRAGEPSEYAFIVLGGSCKEVTVCAPSPKVSSAVVTEEKSLRWGALFGEMALTTNIPYFRTIVAAEPTTVLCLSKRVLDQIYHNNKAKLSEIRIRLMGTEVDLQHAIDHPRGSELFLAFLTTQRAAENLIFYKAIDKYDSMCRMITKQYMQVMHLREKMHAETAGADYAAVTSADVDSTMFPSTQQAAQGLSTTNGTAATVVDGHEKHHTPGEPAHWDDSNKTTIEHSGAHVSAGGAHPNEETEHSFSTSVAGGFASDKTGASSTRSNDSFQSLNLQPIARSKPGFQKPLMESIISMSNFGDLGDDDPLAMSRKSFSVKVKPQPSHLPYSHKTLVTCTDADNGGEEVVGAEASVSQRSRDLQEQLQALEQEEEMGISEQSLRRVVQSGIPIVPAGTTASARAEMLDALLEEGDLSGTKSHLSRDLSAENLHLLSDDTADNGHPHQQGSAEADTMPTAAAAAVQETQQNQQLDSKRRHHRSSFLRNKAEGLSAAYEQSEHLRKHGISDYEATAQDETYLQDQLLPVQRPERSELSMKISRQLHKIHKHIAELREVARNIIYSFIYEGAPQQVNLPGAMRVRTERAFENWTTSLLSASGKGGVIVLSTDRDHSFRGLEGFASMDESEGTKITKLGMTTTSTSYGASYFAESLRANNVGVTPAPMLSGSSAMSHRLPTASSDSFQPTNLANSVNHNNVRSPAAVDTHNAHAEHDHDHIDMTFVDLFKETKNEILKLLRDDKFPRWKATSEFQAFIASVQPYEKDGRKTAADNSGHQISDRDGGQSIGTHP